MDKLLSICISTYNRAKYLEQLLNSVFVQFGDVPVEKIELCINDDSADNETELVVEKYRKLNKVDLIYQRNHVNTGMERAFLSVVEMSSGKYCWILSDDDLMIQGALKIIFETILSNNYDLVIGERNFFVEKYNYQIERQWNFQDNILDNATEYNEILNCGFWASTYICSLIFNRDLWFSSKFRDTDISRFRYFIHIRKIFNALPHSSKSTIFLSKPLMAARGDEFSYTSNSLKVWYYYLVRVLRSLDLYSEEIIEDCSKRISKEMGILVEHTYLLKNKIGVNGARYRLNWEIYVKIRKNLSKKQRLNCLIAIWMPKTIIKSLLLPDCRFDEGFYDLLKRYRLLKMIGYIILFYIRKSFKLTDKNVGK